ncbi:MAG: TOBE domain-containing protein [Paludibacterium sp.]|uniref:TOBE domain-containing protein n=1 Tax=Paludibacterium sp. TaxID=1917523 RepID=UPI0025E55537|nr:TOBE domain-containing protein [Paludibacterium sp.]MBV8047065.1 TOBE domain-containing protein [Paludibacterium sp.]MBV8646423.1 TOBE domain-containing protein [Paludibacterium sp.]
MPRTPSSANDRQSGRLALLAAVQATGSISAAARRVGLSYKGAWQILDAMNRDSREPLFVRTSGGAGGGGTVLSPRGEAMLAAGALLERLSQTLADALDGNLDGALLARLGLHTSARNQFVGRIHSLTQGAVNDLVTVALPQGEKLQVSVTRESSRQMKLAPGGEVLAFFKAGAILIAHPQQAHRIALPNRLNGRIGQIQPGTVNSELTLELPHGLTLHAMLDTATLQCLALAPGAPATALISPSDIILATLA